MQSFRLMKAPLPPLFDSVCLDFGIIPQGAAMNFSQARPKLIDSHFKVLLLKPARGVNSYLHLGGQVIIWRTAATALLFGQNGGQLHTLPTHH